MFKRILVALDGSAASNAGFKSALQLAGDEHAMLAGLHVLDDSSVTLNFEGAYVPAPYVDKLFQSLRQRGREILKQAEAVAKTAGVDMQPVLVESRGQTIAQTILAQARKAKADVIVIGTHGRRGLSRVLMGSDAEAVVRESPVPVLLVRASESAPAKPRAKKAASANEKRTATKRSGAATII
jgi:nucleotide-binding universal stress UspA family protein